MRYKYLYIQITFEWLGSEVRFCGRQMAALRDIALGVLEARRKVFSGEIIEFLYKYGTIVLFTGYIFYKWVSIVSGSFEPG